MLDDTFGWSHARGNEVVPSPWQATAKATTGTIRRTIVSVPARIASSARRLRPEASPTHTLAVRNSLAHPVLQNFQPQSPDHRLIRTPPAGLHV